MEHLIAQLPTEAAVRALVRLLRQAPQEQVLTVVRTILSDDSRPRRMAGLNIARRLVRDEGLILQLLDVGLARKDVSEVRHWLDMAVNTIGYRRVLNHLLQVVEAHPEWLVHAWYQLAPMIRSGAGDLIGKLDQLRALIETALQNQPQELRALWSRTIEAIG